MQRSSNWPSFVNVRSVCTRPSCDTRTLSPSQTATVPSSVTVSAPVPRAGEEGDAGVDARRPPVTGRRAPSSRFGAPDVGERRAAGRRPDDAARRCGRLLVRQGRERELRRLAAQRVEQHELAVVRAGIGRREPAQVADRKRRGGRRRVRSPSSRPPSPEPPASRRRRRRGRPRRPPRPPRHRRCPRRAASSRASARRRLVEPRHAAHLRGDGELRRERLDVDEHDRLRRRDREPAAVGRDGRRRDRRLADRRRRSPVWRLKSSQPASLRSASARPSSASCTSRTRKAFVSCCRGVTTRPWRS